MTKQIKLRIGLVLPNIPIYSETFFNSKIKGLQENGFEVILFSKGKVKRKYSSCKTVFAPDFSFKIRFLIEAFLVLITCLFNFKRALKLYKLNKDDGFSSRNAFKNVLINSFFLPYKLDWLHFGFGTMALQSENVSQTIGAKMAVSFRGFDWYVYLVKFPNCYDKLFSKKVKYHVLSNDMRNSLVGYGISPEQISKITPAIDIDFFKENKNFVSNTIPQFITVSRLHWIKGLDYTLEAFSILKKESIPFQFTIVGEGVEREKLLFTINQLDLSDSVRLIGNISHEEVKTNMEISNYYIQYSLQEGFCNATLEAQAMGLLCIVSDADGLKENIKNEQTGWIVPKRNPILLAAKMIEVINYSEIEKLKIKKNAIERVRKEFNLPTQNELFRSFYLD